MAKYTFVVLSNPTTPGQEAEYNEWYDKIHIPDVLNVPGFVAAQRFKIADSSGHSWLWWWAFLNPLSRSRPFNIPSCRPFRPC